MVFAAQPRSYRVVFNTDPFTGNLPTTGPTAADLPHLVHLDARWKLVDRVVVPPGKQPYTCKACGGVVHQASPGLVGEVYEIQNWGGDPRCSFPHPSPVLANWRLYEKTPSSETTYWACDEHKLEFMQGPAVTNPQGAPPVTPTPKGDTPAQEPAQAGVPTGADRVTDSTGQASEDGGAPPNSGTSDGEAQPSE